MAERFGVSLAYMMAIAEAPTRQEAVELTEKIEQRLRPFVEDGTVVIYEEPPADEPTPDYPRPCE